MRKFLKESYRQLMSSLMNAKTPAGLILVAGGVMVLFSMLNLSGLLAVFVIAYGMYLTFKR